MGIYGDFSGRKYNIQRGSERDRRDKWDNSNKYINVEQCINMRDSDSNNSKYDNGNGNVDKDNNAEYNGDKSDSDSEQYGNDSSSINSDSNNDCYAAAAKDISKSNERQV
jgi:hypothetical protein